jgi:hypothetical protein
MAHCARIFMMARKAKLLPSMRPDVRLQPIRLTFDLLLGLRTETLQKKMFREAKKVMR